MPGNHGELLTTLICLILVVKEHINDKNRMVRDVEFLQSRMSKLEGSAELGQYLLQIVNNKPIALEAEKKQEPQFGLDVPDGNSPPAEKSEGNSAEKL